MNTQTNAQRLADDADHFAEWLDRRSLPHEDVRKYAAELRRLEQSAREGWRYADELEQERKRLDEANRELLEALRYIDGLARAKECRDLPTIVQTAHAAIAKHGGQQ